jgi:hypothetical protein
MNAPAKRPAEKRLRSSILAAMPSRPQIVAALLSLAGATVTGLIVEALKRMVFGR